MRIIRRQNQKKDPAIILFIGLVILIASIALFFSSRYGADSNLPASFSYSNSVSRPECSMVSGFYTSDQLLTLSAPAGSRIFYTTDGSVPGPASSLYEHPLLITDKTTQGHPLSSIPTSPRWKEPLGDLFCGTVLRAVAVNDDGHRGAELVRTFFVSANGRSRFSLPVVSLIADPDALFGFKNGIYVMGKRYENKEYYLRKGVRTDAAWWEYPGNYLKRGKEAQRVAYIEYFGNTEAEHFAANALLQINGNATRGYAQKSLRVTLPQPLLFPLYDTKPEAYSSLVLRNSGNDWNKTMFRDAMMQSLLGNFRIDRQQHQHVVAFIDGEYWGIHDLCERLDAAYLARHYGLAEDSVTVIEQSGLSEGRKSGLKEYRAMVASFKRNDLEADSSFRRVTAMIDLNSFMDFLIANIYFANSDWPGNNVRCWKSAAADSARWRWMIYDLDWGFGCTDDRGYRINLLQKAASTGDIGVIFTSLLRNQGFRELFMHRFEERISKDFDPALVNRRIDAYMQMLKPAIGEHIDRWRAIPSPEDWEKNIRVLHDFATMRPAIQRQQLKDFFKQYQTTAKSR